jgi:two-component system OmpR family sensor kinase
MSSALMTPTSPLRGIRHRLNTRWRLTAWVIVMVVVVTGVAGAIGVKLVERRFTQNIDGELRRSGQELSIALELIDPETLAQIADQSLGNTEQAVLILDAAGGVLSMPAGDAEDPTPLPNLDGRSFRSLLAGAGEPFQIDGDAGTPDYRLLATPLADGRLLVVGTTLDGVREAVTTLVRVLLAVALVASVVLAVVISFVVATVTRPLERMIATAEHVGSGALDTRIPIQGVDDVARLAAALNAMLDRLEAAFAGTAASEATMRRFIADASHELRTPLSAMIGYAELVRSGMATTPNAVERAVERIAAEGERMRLLVEELLTLARLGHGRSADDEIVDVAVLARTAVEDARAIAPDREIELRVADEPFEVVGDVHVLRQAIDNLLANTRAHTPADTVVIVTLDRRDAMVAIVVDDDGPGIDPAASEHLFDRFYRAEPSRARPGGAGLGLAIVAAAVASHGGSVVADGSPRGGARFTVLLPAAPSCPSDPAPSGRSRRTDAGGSVVAQGTVAPPDAAMP